MRAPRNYGRERYERNTARRTRIIEHIRGLYHNLYLAAAPFEAELDRLGQIHAMPEYAKLRQYDRGYIDAIKQSLRDDLWHRQTESAIYWRGQVIVGRDQESRIETGTWNETRYLGHVWKHRPDRFYTMNLEAYGAAWAAHAYPALTD